MPSRIAKNALREYERLVVHLVRVPTLCLPTNAGPGVVIEDLPSTESSELRTVVGRLVPWSICSSSGPSILGDESQLTADE